MTRRDVGMTVVLSLVTCGIYVFYWHFVTTAELKTRSGRTELTPGLDLALGILTCGIWYCYSFYRNASIVHQLLGSRQPHEDRSMLILILNIATLATAITIFISIALLQDEYNKLVDSDAALLPPATVKSLPKNP